MIVPQTLQQLLPLMPEIPTFPVSEMRFSALGRIYVSICKLIVINGLDDELGDRARYARQIEALADAGWQSYCRLSDFESRGRMLHMLFSLTFEPFAVADEHRAKACVRAADALAGEYLAALRAAGADSLPIRGWADVMRCVADLAFPGMEKRENYRALYRGRLASWGGSLGTDGSWKGLSRSDALRRIGLMNRDSYMFPDGGYDAEARRAYEHYVKHFEYPWDFPTVDPESVRELGLLYEIVVQGNLWSVDEALLDRIVSHLWTFATTRTDRDDDLWVYCLSFAVQHACETLDKAVQSQSV